MHSSAGFLRIHNKLSKMIAKIVALSALVAVAFGQAAQYPAGVNPSLCPNFPYCDNSLLAAYNPVPGVAPRLLPAPAAPAAGYPAGVNPASCPNYPYCTNAPLAAAAAPPLPGFSARLYPDGVNPANCPNYPYCN